MSALKFATGLAGAIGVLAAPPVGQKLFKKEPENVTAKSKEKMFSLKKVIVKVMILKLNLALTLKAVQNAIGLDGAPGRTGLKLA